MHILTVVSCIIRLYPQATIVAPIKLLQHYHMSFNIMFKVEPFVLENIVAAATFPVVGGDNKCCPLGGTGWSMAVSMYVVLSV